MSCDNLIWLRTFFGDRRCVAIAMTLWGFAFDQNLCFSFPVNIRWFLYVGTQHRNWLFYFDVRVRVYFVAVIEISRLDICHCVALFIALRWDECRGSHNKWQIRPTQWDQVTGLFY